MAGQFFRGTPPPTPPLSDVSPALFRHQRFWQRVMVYRPILILAGIWVVLLAIALVAYENLLYTQKDPSQTQASAPETAITVYPHQRLERDRAQEDSVPPEPTVEGEQSPATETSPQEANPAQASNNLPQTTIVGISPWSLVALVATCSVGCSLLSRQLQKPRRPRRKNSKRVLPKRQLISMQTAQTRPVQGAAMPSAPKRLATYNPGQPVVPPVHPGPSLQSPPVSVKPQPAPISANMRPHAANPVNVTVVANDTQHPLDWPQDSLVNQADVRRRRSLSSFL
ncbi:MAG: hypothetical protein AAFQ89_12180 [Cyanobacteria bacterium J06626_18]